MAELRVHSLIDTKTKTVNLTGNNTVLIRNHSTAEIVLEAVGVVDLDTVKIVNGSASEWGAVTTDGYIRATFPNVETDTFSVTAEDEYGRYIRKDVVANMIDYINLTCYATNNRPDASGYVLLHCFGKYFNGSFGKVANTLTVQYRYRIAGGSWSSYTSMNVSKSGNTYNAYAELTGLNYEATYEFEYRAADQLMTVDTVLSGVTTLPVFHWGANDFAFEVPVDFKNKGVTGLRIDDSIRFPAESVMIEGNSGTLKLSASTIDMSCSSIKQGDKSVAFAEYGAWLPELYGIDPYSSSSSYSYKMCFGNYLECLGWYSKCGTVATVGFRIKFDCLDRSNDDYIIAISMGNLPYKPLYPASGGGVCSGALMAASQNFQCFVAETDGYITTRTQACDYTSGSILTTSKEGCRYSYSSDALTLSGTITYMTAG